MTDGFWRIRQYSPGHKTGVTVTTIPLKPGKSGVYATEPAVWDTGERLKFVYPDGTEEHYPWTSIIRAEYQPPGNPQSESTP